MVLPGMAFGYVLRSPHAHARIRSIDTAKAKAAPGVLAVLTGADWQASGWGDLPVPGGLKRRDGSAFKPPYPALVKDGCAGSATMSPSWWPRRSHQALDAAELIEVDYEPLPAVISTADASRPGAPRVWDDCADNIGFVQLFGDKAATDAAFAKADHVVKHRFVINRVTAATMEPRGCIGDYNVDRRPLHDLHHAAARASLPRRAGADPQGAGEPHPRRRRRHRRQLRHEIGGLQRGRAGAAGLEGRSGRPVKWISTRSEAFLGDAQARDNVTEAELALDKDGNFLALRVKVVAAIGAYLQTGMNAFTGNIGTLAGVYRIPAAHADVTAVFTHTNPVRPYRGNGRPEAGLCDRAHGRSRSRRARDRSGRAAAPQLHPARCACRSRPRSPSPTTAASSRRAWTWRSSSPTWRASRSAAPTRKKRGKLRGIGLSNTIERAAAQRLRGRRDPLRQVRHGDAVLRQRHPGPGARDHLQADRLRPARHRSGRGALHPGRHRPGVRRRRHRRLALGDLGGSACHARGREDRHQGEADRRPSAQGRRRRREIRRRRSSPARRPTAP